MKLNLFLMILIDMVGDMIRRIKLSLGLQRQERIKSEQEPIN